MYLEKDLNGFLNIKPNPTYTLKKKTATPVLTNTFLVFKIWDSVTSINDPELNISINLLGLVYSIFLKKTKPSGFVNCFIVVTLTSYGCPAGPNIILDIKNQLFKLSFIARLDIVLVWNPYWSKDLVSEDVKRLL